MLQVLKPKISNSVSEENVLQLKGIAPFCQTLTHFHVPLMNRLRSLNQAQILFTAYN